MADRTFITPNAAMKTPVFLFILCISCFPLLVSGQVVIDHIIGSSADFYLGEVNEISADGSTLVTSSRLNDESFQNAGLVRVFERIGDNWEPKGQDILGSFEGEQFGFSVSVSKDGNRIVVGAPYYSEEFSQRGAIRIYDWDGTTWIQNASTIPGLTGGDLLGWSVSISEDGTRIVAGAPRMSENATYSGGVRTFVEHDTEWLELDDIIIGTEFEQRLGSNCRMSKTGDILLVQSRFETIPKSNVRVYKWLSSSWQEIQTIEPGNEADFGYAIELSQSGVRFIIGSPGFSSGSVRVYETQESLDDWQLITKYEEEKEVFGISVSMDGIGNYFGIAYAETQVDRGYVDIYSFVDFAEPFYSYAPMESNFSEGYRHRLSNDSGLLFVSDPNYSGEFTNSGKVTVLEINGVTTTENVEASINVPFHLNQKQLIIGLKEMFNLRLVDRMGRSVLLENNCIESVDLSHLYTGLYFGQVLTNEGEASIVFFLEN